MDKKNIFLVIKRHYEGNHIVSIFEKLEEARLFVEKLSADHPNNEYTLEVSRFGEYEPSECYWYEEGKLTLSWVRPGSVDSCEVAMTWEKQAI